MQRLNKAARMQSAWRHFNNAMQSLGISPEHATQLLRLEKRLHRWHELECGIDNGGVERDEKTGKVFWYNAMTGRRSPFRDYETPALKRLAKVMANYPDLGAYVQTDPRGCALYVYRKAELAEREINPADIDCFYSSVGIAIGVWP